MAIVNVKHRVWQSAFVLGVAAILGAATRLAPRALVHVDSVGIRGVQLNESGLVGRVLIYARGPARVGFGGEEPRVLTDTVRLRSLPSFTVDVTDSDVHIELVGGQLPGGGVLTVGGAVTGGPATHVSATGRHLVLLHGGVGIRVLDGGDAKPAR